MRQYRWGKSPTGDTLHALNGHSAGGGSSFGLCGKPMIVDLDAPQMTLTDTISGSEAVCGRCIQIAGLRDERWARGTTASDTSTRAASSP